MLDKLDFWPGWKAAVTGGLTAAFNLVNSILAYRGLDALPADIVVSVNAIAVPLISLFLWLKYRRDPDAPA